MFKIPTENKKMKIQTRPPVFDIIQPSKPLVLLYSNELTFSLNARFFSILNRKGEFLRVHCDFRLSTFDFHLSILQYCMKYGVDEDTVLNSSMYDLLIKAYREYRRSCDQGVVQQMDKQCTACC